MPALEQFKPEVVLVSAGFDAHERDPLGGMRMTTAGYVRLVQMLDNASKRVACARPASARHRRRLPSVALRECLEGAIGALS